MFPKDLIPKVIDFLIAVLSDQLVVLSHCRTTHTTRSTPTSREDNRLPPPAPTRSWLPFCSCLCKSDTVFGLALFLAVVCSFRAGSSAEVFVTASERKRSVGLLSSAPSPVLPPPPQPVSFLTAAWPA